MSQFTVNIQKKCRKGINDLTKKDKYTLMRLLDNIENFGPVQPCFKNYSKLGNTTYHCHLSLHKVVCWQLLNSNIVEVYYVGSRENAPY